jgi:hypothetical protein
MIKNYTNRLNKLEGRRFDYVKKSAIYSKSFEKPEHGLATKYCFEAMNEIEHSYTQATLAAAEKVYSELGLKLPQKGINVQFEYQGSIMTNTHIKLHSDIDILAILTKFYQVDHPVLPENLYKGDSLADLRELRKEAYNILSLVYPKIDTTSPKALEVQLSNPDRKVDVVPCYWHLTSAYDKDPTSALHCGVQVYNLAEHKVKEDFPFLHIHYVKSKGERVDGYKKLVRLLKTLKADSETRDISLSSFEIASLVYHIEDFRLIKPADQQLALVHEASIQLAALINNKSYRETLMSPNGKEIVFGSNQAKVEELKKLKIELDELIADLREELKVQEEYFQKSYVY